MRREKRGKVLIFFIFWRLQIGGGYPTPNPRAAPAEGPHPVRKKGVPFRKARQDRARRGLTT
jgi:hypothetical protein